MEGDLRYINSALLVRHYGEIFIIVYNTGTNKNGRFLKHYSEKNGRKVWNREACQTGLAPNSPECEAFDYHVLMNDEKVNFSKINDDDLNPLLAKRLRQIRFGSL